MLRYRTWNKRKKGKIMIAGVLTTAMAFATSVTATYAWFNLETQHIDQIMNFGISEDPDRTLDMGYYDVEGHPIFSTEEAPLKFDETGLRTYFGPAGYDPSKPLDPVTGFGSSLADSGKPVLSPSFHAGMDPKTWRNKEDGSQPEGAGTYYQFEFAFRCAQDCWLYLSPQSQITPGDNANKFDKESGVPLDEDKLNEAVHAMRVRFTGLNVKGEVEHDYVTVPTAVPKEGQSLPRKEGAAIDDVYYGGVANLSGGSGFYDVTEVDDDKEEIVYGQIGDEKIFQEARGDGHPVENPDFLHAGHAEGVKVVDVAKMKEKGLIQKENAAPFASHTLEDGVGQTSSDPILSLKAKQSQKLIVTVYLEGWDPYCTNDIGQAAMSLDLVFTGLVH